MSQGFDIGQWIECGVCILRKSEGLLCVPNFFWSSEKHNLTEKVMDTQYITNLLKLPCDK